MGVCGLRHVSCRGGFVWRGYGRLGVLVPWILETRCVGAFLLHVSADLCPFRSDLDGYVCVYVVVSERMHPRWVGQHEFPGTSLPLFSTFSVRSCPWSGGRVPARVHSTSAPRTMLSKCVSLLSVRLFVSRVRVLWFPARTHERNGSYFVSFFVFFLGGVRTEFVRCFSHALPRENSVGFSVSYLFLERVDTEEIERKKEGRTEGHHHEEKEPRERPVVSSSHVVVCVVCFLRSWVVERFHVFSSTLFHVHRPEPTVVALEGDRRKTSHVSLRVVDPNSIVSSFFPFLSFPFPFPLPFLSCERERE